MIRLEQLLPFYTPNLHDKPKAILREYLQVKILHYIYQHPLAQKLCFIGWTALRLVYHSARFSEDLDFDNWWLTEAEFSELGEHIATTLGKEWYEVEMKQVFKWAYHCEIKIPQLLYDNNLADMATQKLVIKIDTAAQWFDYDVHISALQMFEYAYPVRVVPQPVLVSMKLLAFFGRIKGRDIFDLSYLLSMGVMPDYRLLHSLNIANWEELLHAINTRLATLNLDQLNQDVAPFLFQTDNQSVKLFPELITRIEWK